MNITETSLGFLFTEYHFSNWIECFAIIFLVLIFFFSLVYVEFFSITSIPLYCQDTYRSFRKLCGHYHIKENIAIGESIHVKSPMILGFFKPIIILSVGIVNQ